MTQNRSKSLLICVTYSTCSMNSICHFRGEQQLCSSQQIKWLQSQTRIMGVMSERWDFFLYVSNVSRDFERDWARADTSIRCITTHLSQLSKEPGHYFPTTKDPQTQTEWICNPYVKKPGESTLSLLEGDQLLEIPNDGGLKSMFKATSNLHTFWIKVKAE